MSHVHVKGQEVGGAVLGRSRRSGAGWAGRRGSAEEEQAGSKEPLGALWDM